VGLCGVEMDKMKIDKVVIFGAGRMGSTIAITMAMIGIKVIVRSRDNGNKILTLVESRLTKAVEKGELTVDYKKEILRNISGTTNINIAAEADLILETIIENFEEKKKLFKQLDLLCSPETIFATNTSALSIKRLSSVTNRPDRFLGMHFFNPADKMKLVEIIKTDRVSESVVREIKKFVKKLNKEPIIIKDIPGFVVNRLLFPVINEAANLVYKGVISPEDLDKAALFGLNHPVGPLRLADLIGLDVCVAVLSSIYKSTKEIKYAPSLILLQKIKAGQLGKKTGRGFYNYGRIKKEGK